MNDHQKKNPISRQNKVLRAVSQEEGATGAHQEDFYVLVVNSSHEMAKEITLQLSLAMPGCAIIYAPTISIASWLLRRRRIDLVISSTILPDGHVARLQNDLQKLPKPPDVVVVGSPSMSTVRMLTSDRYQCARMERISSRRKFAVADVPTAQNNISGLGADIRNDLNNPLQEIVAMVFVAQLAAELTPTTAQALSAIDRAASSLATLVKGLEDRIRQGVGG